GCMHQHVFIAKVQRDSVGGERRRSCKSFITYSPQLQECTYTALLFQLETALLRHEFNQLLPMFDRSFLWAAQFSLHLPRSLQSCSGLCSSTSVVSYLLPYTI